MAPAVRKPRRMSGVCAVIPVFYSKYLKIKIKVLFEQKHSLHYNIPVMSRYMLVLIMSIAMPWFLSFWPPLRFWRHWQALVKTLALIVVIFGGWDIFATWRTHWYFNPEGVWRFRIINLPVEEVLFFVVIPFCCIFSWEVITFIKHKAQ
jgi:lycopene cyclase domain-containing protein